MTGSFPAGRCAAGVVFVRAVARPDGERHAEAPDGVQAGDQGGEQGGEQGAEMPVEVERRRVVRRPASARTPRLLAHSCLVPSPRSAPFRGRGTAGA
ncbi:hypothetical protein UG55_100931 [Frankia sp. EI5c]|uniref:hypothetical protein n=1 Tax=Frankia sp. EI5c TaxID=683316 RepID=UPI0007C2AE83|nr:hypothetical protein [Frankia sp. EI5c]OAA27148.1 hypothetical protein UG55_100931 [Frankia sp. EI5c]